MVAYVFIAAINICGLQMSKNYILCVLIHLVPLPCASLVTFPGYHQLKHILLAGVMHSRWPQSW